MLIESKLIEISLEIDEISRQNDFSNTNISYFDGSYEEFFQQFLLTNTPCIIPNAAKYWKCSSLWVKDDKPNIDYLNSIYGMFALYDL